MISSYWRALITVLAMTYGGAALANNSNDIDLKLFGNSTVEPYDGCRFALWPRDKDPETDKYAYVFFAPIPDAEALPGSIKIGEDLLELSKIDITAADTGELQPFQLYRSHDQNTTLLMEIISQSRTEVGIVVADAWLTFLQPDRFPFQIRVKGLNGCPAVDVLTSDPASPGEPIRLGAEVEHKSLDDIPGNVRQAISEQAPECDVDSTPGYSSSYAISGTMSLWMVPCNMYARNNTSVLVTARKDAGADVLQVAAPPGSDGDLNHELTLAMVLVANGMVTAVDIDPNNNCGSFERHQLVAGEGDAVSLELLEFREKLACDGGTVEPEDYPVVYSR